MEMSSISNRKLADLIDKVVADREAAASALWDLASGPNERWNDLVERLGDPKPHETALEYRATDPRHPLLIAYRAADELYENVRWEARKRCGPATHAVHYPTLLRSMGRRRAA